MSSTAAPPLKLTVEMVPSSTWYNNMRKVVSQETWDTIRRSVYREYGYRCGIVRHRVCSTHAMAGYLVRASSRA